MELMIEIAAIAMVGALCTLVVRKHTAEIGLVLALAVGVLIVTLIIGSVEAIVAMMEYLGELAGLSQAIIAPVLKTVGIAMVTKLTAELCRDTGEGGIASFVELAGIICATVVTIPLLEAVLDMVVDLL